MKPASALLELTATELEKSSWFLAQGWNANYLHRGKIYTCKKVRREEKDIDGQRAEDFFICLNSILLRSQEYFTDTVTVL